MIIFIAALFLFSSLFFWGFLLIRPRWINFGLIFFILLNSVPFIPFDYLVNTEMRLGGVPIAYIPLLFLFFNAFIACKGKINYELKYFFILTVSLLSILLMQSLALASNYYSFFAYYAMWLVNLFGFFFFANFTSKQTEEWNLLFLKSYVFTIAAVCCIGCLKYLGGVITDANFFPMVNRNGTVIPVVFAIPLCLSLFYSKKLSFAKTILILIAITAMIVLTKSRMGLFAAIFSLVAYYQLLAISHFRNAKYSLISVNIYLVLALTVLCLLGGVIMRFLDTNNEFIERLTKTKETVYSFVRSEDLGSSGENSDYARQELLKAGIEVAKNNWLFGTGVGLDNYRVELEKVMVFDRDSKPHNFFISYLGEFGIFAFSILMATLLLIFFYFEKFRRVDSALKNDEEQYVVIAFETLFLAFILTLTMNEYVTFPFVWFFLGIGIGVMLKNQQKNLQKQNVTDNYPGGDQE